MAEGETGGDWRVCRGHSRRGRIRNDSGAEIEDQRGAGAKRSASRRQRGKRRSKLMLLTSILAGGRGVRLTFASRGSGPANTGPTQQRYLAASATG
jgi:hypothetical protein